MHYLSHLSVRVQRIIYKKIIRKRHEGCYCKVPLILQQFASVYNEGIINKWHPVFSIIKKIVSEECVGLEMHGFCYWSKITTTEKVNTTFTMCARNHEHHPSVQNMEPHWIYYYIIIGIWKHVVHCIHLLFSLFVFLSKSPQHSTFPQCSVVWLCVGLGLVAHFSRSHLQKSIAHDPKKHSMFGWVPVSRSIQDQITFSLQSICSAIAVCSSE